MTEQRIVQLLVTIGAIGALLLHKLGSVKLDSTTLVLLGLAAIPWMVSLIKSIEVPGIGKIELNELKNEIDKFSGIAQKADEKASLAREELDQISMFVFNSLINKNEIAILEGLEAEEPYELGEVGGKISDQLYQLRDSEFISMGSVSDLKRKNVSNLHKYATITDKGSKYLEFLRYIEKAKSNKTLHRTR